MAAVLIGTEQHSGVVCAECGLVFYVPSTVDQAWRKNHVGFRCPHGHGLVYPAKKTEDPIEENKRLKAELEQLKEQQLWAQTQSSRRTALSYGKRWPWSKK